MRRRIMLVDLPTTSGLMEFLAIEFERKGRKNLAEALARVSPTNLQGTWLNMGSGNGIANEEIAKAAGIQRVIHFDNFPGHKDAYRQWLEETHSMAKARKLADKNFRVTSIDGLLKKGWSEKLAAPICTEEIKGVMMVLPWQDIPGLIWPAFEVAKTVLKVGGQMVTLADRSEWPFIADAAKRFMFKGVKIGGAGVFTQTGEYIR